MIIIIIIINNDNNNNNNIIINNDDCDNNNNHNNTKLYNSCIKWYYTKISFKTISIMIFKNIDYFHLSEIVIKIYLFQFSNYLLIILIRWYS